MKEKVKETAFIVAIIIGVIIYIYCAIKFGIRL